MSYRHSQGCLGVSSNIQFVRGTFAAERQNISMDILPTVPLPKYNATIFPQESRGTYRGPPMGVIRLQAEKLHAAVDSLRTFLIKS